MSTASAPPTADPRCRIQRSPRQTGRSRCPACASIGGHSARGEVRWLDPVHRLAAAALRQQVFPQCASADCPRRSHMFPVYWMRSSGTEFDGRWYCSADCLQRSVRLAVQNHISRFLFERPRTYRLPLGLLLVNRGQITYAQLKEALRLQRQSGGRLGNWLRQMNATSHSVPGWNVTSTWGKIHS